MSDGTLRERWIDAVFAAADISAEVQVFLLFLARYYMDEEGRVSEKREDLARTLRCHPRKVSDKHASAIKAGLLRCVVRGQKHQTSVHQATIPGSQGADNRHPETSAQGAGVRPPERSQGAGFYHPETSAQGARYRHPEASQGADNRHPANAPIYKARAHAHSNADPSTPNDHESAHGGPPVVAGLFEDVETSLRSKKTPARKRASEPAEDPNFDRFWQTYPKRVAKPAAMKAWKAAMKRKADPEQIILAARRYATDPQRREADSKYTAHPATWLNQERYADEPAPSKAAASGISPRDEWKYQR